MSFDPSARASKDSGIFGLDFSTKVAKLVLIPVPWEATTSYGSGTSKAPQAILQASHQVDLFDIEVGNAFEHGYCMLKPDSKVAKMNAQAKLLAKQVRQLEDSKPNSPLIAKKQKQVNELSNKLNDFVYTEAKNWLERGKLVGLVGGDHSTPYGMIRAIGEKYEGDYGILHIDAHHDLRKAYEGFTYSHASIMYNVMESKWAPKNLVQVGIRDFSEDERNYAREKSVDVFYDTETQYRKIHGESWQKITEDIVRRLPKNVYVSFDIDGLNPVFCPNTGTPVPGGLEYSEALYLFKALRDHGRKLIGFDLNEVAPNKSSEWDANVGARMLYKLCGWLTVANLGAH